MIAFLLGALIAIALVGGVLWAVNRIWPLPDLDDLEAES